MKSSLFILITAALMMIQGTSAQGRRGQVMLRGKGMKVQVSSGRAKMLTGMVGKLINQRFSGYASLYNGQGRQGATLITTIERKQVNRWFNSFGRSSIGIASSVSPGVNKGSSFIRLGDKLYYFKALRGGEEHHGSPCVPVDIRKKTGTLTENTFPVSPAEMKALKAFYHSRFLNLIKDKTGKAIVPRYKMMGASGTFASEGCTHTCTSGLNPLWWKAFAQNIPAIREFGQKNNIPELASAEPGMVTTLKEFAGRTAGVQSGRKAVIRANFDKAPLLTIFNTGVGSNPIRDLSWKGGKWNGLTEPRVMLDRPASENQTPSFTGERVSLRDFHRSMKDAL